MMNEARNVSIAALNAELSHSKNENVLLREHLQEYDRSFAFLCAYMERSQLCRAISKIKSDVDVPLPPAIRNFLSRNINMKDSNIDNETTTTNTLIEPTPPVVASAQALTKWAGRHLEKKQFQESRSPLRITRNRDAADSSLQLAESHFKLRDLEQQLRSSRAIREDLLNKAIEAEQRRRSKSTNKSSTGSNNGASKNSNVPVVEMQQWKSKCDQLMAEVDALKISLSNNSSRGGGTTGENKTSESNQQWLESELKDAKHTIRQLQALAQAKQDKIEIMQNLLDISR